MPFASARPAHPPKLARGLFGVCAQCDVRALAICAGLDDCDVERLEQIMVVRHYTANEAIIEQGAPRRSVFSITAGMVRLFSDLPDGRRQIAGFLLPGDYLGLVDDQTYAHSAEAIVPASICVFAVREMEALLAEFPSLRDRLYTMTRRALKQARDNQLILGRLAPVEKLASFLLILASRQAQSASPHPRGIVHLAMTRTDIADYLGLTIETVSRSFTKLRNQGLIRLPETHLVEIADRTALIAVAGIELAT